MNWSKLLTAVLAFGIAVVGIGIAALGLYYEVIVDGFTWFTNTTDPRMWPYWLAGVFVMLVAALIVWIASRWPDYIVRVTYIRYR